MLLSWEKVTRKIITLGLMISKPFDFIPEKAVSTWADLPRKFFREETLELLNWVVLNISMFSWALFKVSWKSRKEALVTIGQGKCVISYIINTVSWVWQTVLRLRPILRSRSIWFFVDWPSSSAWIFCLPNKSSQTWCRALISIENSWA